jgi:hypothetical protein
MKLHAYGDSWTEGEGANWNVESQIKDRQQLQLYRNQHSWVNHLSKKLGLEPVNNGWSGRANNLIFNDVINDLRNDKIKKNDFVVIMWSSTLRDYVPFLPKGEWISWGQLELSILPHKFTESYQFGNDKFNSFLSDYKKFFLLELFNQNYYNIVNQNYIIFLQKMLDEYKINYLMCDGFDLMVQDLDKKNDVTHLINKKKYWGFAEKSIESWMMKNYKNNPVWEVKIPNPIKVAQHPNIEGYKLITEELYNYIVKNELYEC